MTSKDITAFLDLMDAAQAEFTEAARQYTIHEDEMQDILHEYDRDNLSSDERKSLSKKLWNVRRMRRQSDNTQKRLEPVVRWISKSKPTMRELRALAEELSRVEGFQAIQKYHRRTNILEQAQEAAP